MRRQSLRHDGGFWRRLAYAGSAHGPKWWIRWSPPAFAAIFYAFVHRNRRGAVANLGRILDGGRLRAHWMALRMFVRFAQCMTEMMEQLGPRPRPVRFDAPRRDLFVELLARGRGLVLVTAHLGNWDASAKGLHDLGYAVHMVMSEEINPTAQLVVRQMRERANVRVIYAGGSVFSGLRMLGALRRGEIVALQLDRTAPGAPSLRVPFFGEPASFPVGPFALARAARAPVLPIFAVRLGPCHYELRITDPVEVPPGPREEAIAEGMRRAVASFEDVVREFPDQWFQFAPFWNGNVDD